VQDSNYKSHVGRELSSQRVSTGSRTAGLRNRLVITAGPETGALQLARQQFSSILEGSRIMCG